MKKKELLAMLDNANGVEESAIITITQLILSALDRNRGVGASPAAMGEMQKLLTTLKEDSQRHQRLIEETRAIVIKEGRDEF